MRPGAKHSDKLFDGTAPDGVEQLSASLLSQLTPPWPRWFGLTLGPEIDEMDRHQATGALEGASNALQSHFDRSNFAVEMHQCYMDLVTVGTASLLFEEAPAGDPSAFRFTAVPLSQVVFEESADGRLDTTYRRSELTLAQFKQRFPKAPLPQDAARQAENNPAYNIAVLEAVYPENGRYRYLAILDGHGGHHGPAEHTIIAEGRFQGSPFINFRWLKAPGEIYGRSPVMKALPDIKTANKVVELTLKNASIAVTGIWQADDDGVLNPASIKLAPGTIIPKAVGSAGLTPLNSPGRFDISELVLKDLRQNIRRALLVDKLGQPDAPRMTATEVVESSSEMARLLGATYGRLQSELLTPLISRGLVILARRGAVPEMQIDGHTVDLEYKSPLARQQAQRDTQNAMAWIDLISRLGPEAMAIVDRGKLVRWLAQAYSVPEDLLVPQHGPSGLAQVGELLGELPLEDAGQALGAGGLDQLAEVLMAATGPGQGAEGPVAATPAEGGPHV